MGRKKKKQKIARISRGEAKLLEVLWQEGPLTLSKTHAKVSDKNGRPVLQAVQAQLYRMVTKGLVERRGEYPAIFIPLITREEMQSQFFENLIEVIGTDFSPLLQHLAKKHTLTESELTMMRTILDAHENQTQP
ncbi:MAG: BlaI/MecI/CopY family transcriptional regulator [Thermoguttaceae bacterium]|nr:BlaI/MecI/CopY family transcriptional regulator [Thermoguttaceae bacterium]